ncbi:MAG TPA: hypothetical protein VHU80_10920 [Polyangiaceae bacterium]|jgi:hypothetical protein|nr:hypothetical protein [Polyangiaceae bacterium]
MIARGDAPVPFPALPDEHRRAVEAYDAVLELHAGGTWSWRSVNAEGSVTSGSTGEESGVGSRAP